MSKAVRAVLIGLLLVVVSTATLAEGILDSKVTANFDNKPVGEVLADLAKQVGAAVTVDPKVSGNITVQLDETTLAKALDEVCRLTGSYYGLVQEKSLVVASPDPAGPYYASIAKVEVVKINHLTAQNVMTALSKHPYFAYMTLADPQLNSITITAPPAIIERLKADIRAIDIAKRVVEIQIGVLDTSRVKMDDFGTTWEYTKGPGEDKWTIQLANMILGFSDERHGKILAKLVWAYSQDRLEILAQPRLAARDGEKAELSIGKKVYVLTTYYIGAPATLPAAPPTGIETGVRLQITPRALEGDMILCTFEVAVSEIVGTGPQGLPVTNERRLTSSLVVKSGETIISGGLLTKLALTYRRYLNIPIIKDIPLIRDLFREKHRETREQEITILITPRFVEAKEPEVIKAKEVIEERKPAPVVPKSETKTPESSSQ